eukprot:TRINITY_DN62485_c0_g1_i3.p1 TRINITY_DN62485_c0_g1~~TRINITY_DN62485_c0_g1_i3.p1  ORF type:complete len:105 (-),score=2.36 TRINITY_DN62485_c0_g1_i3:82-396(-)
MWPEATFLVVSYVCQGASYLARPLRHARGPRQTPKWLQRRLCSCLQTLALTTPEDLLLNFSGHTRNRRPYSALIPVSYTHLRAHETPEHLVCRLLLEKKKHRQR